MNPSCGALLMSKLRMIYRRAEKLSRLSLPRRSVFTRFSRKTIFCFLALFLSPYFAGLTPLRVPNASEVFEVGEVIQITEFAQTQHLISSDVSDAGFVVPRVPIVVGVVVRGNEWFPPLSQQKRAVINALHGLVRVFQAESVLLLVDSPSGCASRPHFLAASACEDLSQCRSVTFKAPEMHCIFGTILRAAEARHSTDIVGYINGDIMIFESFARSLETVQSSYERFLMVGKRHNADFAPSLPKTSHGWRALEQRAKSYPLDGGYAIDYFFLRRQDASRFMYNFPPFIIGTQRWDNTLLAMIYRDTQMVVVDASETATALHQVQNPIKAHGERPAARVNEALASRAVGYDYLFGSIDNANAQLIWTEPFDADSTRKVVITVSRTNEILRAAFVSGFLPNMADVPVCARQWLATLISRTSGDVVFEAEVASGIAKALKTELGFQRFVGTIYTVYEPRTRLFIFTNRSTISNR